jgi:hypothetical protein
MHLLCLLETEPFRKIALLHEIITNGVLDFSLQTKHLDLAGVKPSVRVTLLLNYLFLLIQNNSLLLSRQ